MRKIFLFFFLALVSNQILAQTDTTKSVYKNLKTLKYIPGDYKNNESAMDSCKPCILKTYDNKGNLFSKGIQYTDCPVGYWIEYYPNGKIKLIGHYKENETGNWDNAFDKGYCRQDGAFTYYNKKGEILYTENWKDGNFINQVPEQSTTEIWNVELTLNGMKVDKQVLTPEEVSQLVITPKYKNSSTAGTNLTVKFQVLANGHKQIEQTFTPDEFKNIDVKKMIAESGMTSTTQNYFTLMIFNNGKYIFIYSLNVKI